MLSQHMDEGSFLLKPRNKSSVPTDCFRTISYLNIQTHMHSERPAHLQLNFDMHVFSLTLAVAVDR